MWHLILGGAAVHRCDNCLLSESALQIAEKVVFRSEVASAAKAVDENKPVIAAVNRCATQNQMRVFQHSVLAAEVTLRYRRYLFRSRCCRLLIQSFQMPKSAGGCEHRYGDGSVVGHVHQEACGD